MKKIWWRQNKLENGKPAAGFNRSIKKITKVIMHLDTKPKTEILLSCYWWSPCATSFISCSYVCVISFLFSHSSSTLLPEKQRAVFGFPKKQSWLLHEKLKLSLWKSKEGTFIFWKKSWQRTLWWWKYLK